MSGYKFISKAKLSAKGLLLFGRVDLHGMNDELCVPLVVLIYV